MLFHIVEVAQRKVGRLFLFVPIIGGRLVHAGSVHNRARMNRGGADRMKRIIAVILSILTIVSAIEILTTKSVSASSSDVKVIINGQLLKGEGNSAYKLGSTAIIPLKEAAKALKYKVTFEQNTKTVLLTGIKTKIEYKIGEDWITINGIEKKEFLDELVLRKGRLYVPLSFFMALGLVTTYDARSNLAEIYTPEVTTNAIAGLLATGQYQELEDRFFRDDLKHGSNVAILQQNWSGPLTQAGNYYGIKSTESSHGEDGFTIQCVLGFADREVSLEIVLDKFGKITSLRENKIPKRDQNL